MIGKMEWFKALHVIFVIAWMAGIFYLPRLFVYHSRSEIGSESSETFKVMERKLLRIIMGPGLVLSWLFGLIMIFAYDAFDFSSAWSWIKLAGVVAMTLFHIWSAGVVRRFATDERPYSERTFRMLNEVPTILIMIIVIMVIVRPF